MVNNSTRTIFATFIFLSWLLFASSIRLNLFQQFRNYQNDAATTDNDNDELGGSLLDVVEPSPGDEASQLFAEDVSASTPETTTDNIIENANTPAPAENTPVPAENTPVPAENTPAPAEPTPAPTPAPEDTQSANNNTNSTITNTTSTTAEPQEAQAPTAMKKSTPKAAAKTASTPTVPIIIESNKDCNFTVSSSLHTPYPTPETTNMRYFSLIALIIFGSGYLFIRFTLSFLKGSDKGFFSKGLKILSNQMLLYFIIIAVITPLYAYGVLDSIPINWQFLIAALSVFGVAWVLFCILILTFSLFVIQKWEMLETKCKDNFKTIKTRYEAIANRNYDRDVENKMDPSGVFELYEYLTLKVYFCIPFYPAFKASTLRREFKFNIYLKNCLLQKLRLFFKLSWTCWICTVFVVFAWSVLIAPKDPLFLTIFMMCIPLAGLLIGLLIYIYMRVFFRRVVQEINQDNYMSYNDVQNFNQSFASGQFTNFPVYIDKAIEKPEDAKVSRVNFHEFFHNRTPSLYEDQILFGATGFFLIINILQAVGFIFIAWGVAIFFKHYNEIADYYGLICLAFIIPTLLAYIVIYAYLLSISLRWYTIISSIEMKRNEEAINKTINYHLKKSAKMANTVFMTFKKLYFDMMINKYKINDNRGESFNNLGRKIFQQLIDTNIIRFKKVPEEEERNRDALNPKTLDDFPIDMNSELRPFLKASGNKLNEKEIEFMLHLIEDFDPENRNITRKQLYDICGAIIHFGSLSPEEILNFVFDTYYDSRDDIESVNRRDSKEMTMENIESFLNYYNEYFSSEEVSYIKEETQYLGPRFSRDAFTQLVLSARRYNPN